MRQLTTFLSALLVLFGCAPVGYDEGVARQIPTNTPSPYADMSLEQLDFDGYSLQFYLPETYAVLNPGRDYCEDLGCVAIMSLNQIHPDQTDSTKPESTTISHMSVAVYPKPNDSVSMVEWVAQRTYDPLVSLPNDHLRPTYYGEFDITEMKVNEWDGIAFTDEMPMAEESQQVLFDFYDYFVQIGYTPIGGDHDKAIFAFDTIVDTIRVPE